MRILAILLLAALAGLGPPAVGATPPPPAGPTISTLTVGPATATWTDALPLGYLNSEGWQGQFMLSQESWTRSNSFARVFVPEEITIDDKTFRGSRYGLLMRLKDRPWEFVRMSGRAGLQPLGVQGGMLWCGRIAAGRQEGYLRAASYFDMVESLDLKSLKGAGSSPFIRGEAVMVLDNGFVTVDGAEVTTSDQRFKRKSAFGLPRTAPYAVGPIRHTPTDIWIWLQEAPYMARGLGPLQQLLRVHKDSLLVEGISQQKSSGDPVTPQVPHFLLANGRFYELISSQKITWTDATTGESKSSPPLGELGLFPIAPEIADGKLWLAGREYHAFDAETLQPISKDKAGDPPKRLVAYMEGLKTPRSYARLLGAAGTNVWWLGADGTLLCLGDDGTHWQAPVKALGIESGRLQSIAFVGGDLVLLAGKDLHVLSGTDRDVRTFPGSASEIKPQALLGPAGPESVWISAGAAYGTFDLKTGKFSAAELPEGFSNSWAPEKKPIVRASLGGTDLVLFSSKGDVLRFGSAPDSRTVITPVGDLFLKVAPEGASHGFGDAASEWAQRIQGVARTPEGDMMITGLARSVLIRAGVAKIGPARWDALQLSFIGDDLFGLDAAGAHRWVNGAFRESGRFPPEFVDGGTEWRIGNGIAWAGICSTEKFVYAPTSIGLFRISREKLLARFKAGI